jgi:hypothetical protein
MMKLRNIIIVAIIAGILFGWVNSNDNLHKQYRINEEQLITIAKQSKTVDSLKNATRVYDTLLSNMLADTSKINVNVIVKLDNPVNNIKKEKKGIFKWFK